MKAVLRLEYIGASTWDRLRQFERFERAVLGCRRADDIFVDGDAYMDLPGPRVLAYRVLGPDAGSVGPVYGHRDYSQANSKGTRGVMVVYTLEQGVIYRVKAPTSWRSSSQFFAVVDDDGSVLRMSKAEVLEWASERWA